MHFQKLYVWLPRDIERSTVLCWNASTLYCELGSPWVHHILFCRYCFLMNILTYYSLWTSVSILAGSPWLRKISPVLAYDLCTNNSCSSWRRSERRKNTKEIPINPTRSDPGEVRSHRRRPLVRVRQPHEYYIDNDHGFIIGSYFFFFFFTRLMHFACCPWRIHFFFLCVTLFFFTFSSGGYSGSTTRSAATEPALNS